MNEKRIQQRLTTFNTIIKKYDREQPFARFLTQFFKANRQMGSSDRRFAARLSYNFFRLGGTLEDLPIDQRLAIAEFLCEKESDFSKYIFPEIVENINLNLTDKIKYCEEHFQFKLESLFPLGEHISDQIDKEKFYESHFIQPDLFIRIHPGNGNKVKDALKKNEVPFNEIAENVLSFVNGTKLNQINDIQGKYEVQDYSSQQTAKLFNASAEESWWDACAGSGGKSILLMHEQPSIRLLVSDIRNSILRNLDERFIKAGISKYRRKVIDLTKESTVLKGELFDGIIVDAPCSGSGTWGRAPEMLSHFDRNHLQYYCTLQKEIVSNVMQHLRPGKPLIYITCSVYEQENEEIVRYLEGEGMKLQKKEYFKGYENRGDTLFAARLTC